MHEFAHALAASKLGDDLPEREGRLTLSPLAHIDPIGTLLIPALAAFTSVPLFGWGRPVNTLPNRYTRKVSMRGGMALVSFAGPLANLLMAVVTSGLFIGLVLKGVLDVESPFSVLLQHLAQLNVVLFLFNLIPVPPLDGSKIVAWIFGQRIDGLLDTLAGFGPIALYAVVLLAGSGISFASSMVIHGLYTGFAGLLGS